MQRSCPHCQSPVIDTQRFCRYCGFRLDEGVQDFVKTLTFQRPTMPMPEQARPAAFSPSWPRTMSSETTPLVAGRCRRPFHRFAAVAAIVALGVGAFLAYVSHEPAVQRVAEAPIVIPIEPPPAVPVPPVATGPLAQPVHPGPRVRMRLPVAEAQLHQRIGELLQRQAALTQQKIELLHKRIERRTGLSERERQALMQKLEQLQEEQLGVLAAAEALKSETLQDVLQGIDVSKDVMKQVETELKRLNVQVDLRGIEDLSLPASTDAIPHRARKRAN